MKKLLMAVVSALLFLSGCAPTRVEMIATPVATETMEAQPIVDCFHANRHCCGNLRPDRNRLLPRGLEDHLPKPAWHGLAALYCTQLPYGSTENGERDPITALILRARKVTPSMLLPMEW
ncbi:MAG: hypothetical protein IPO22_18025 [Anaerolineales bacterium]|nr:hypothetical protein [Anaerolineales bacterium]